MYPQIAITITNSASNLQSFCNGKVLINYKDQLYFYDTNGADGGRQVEFHKRIHPAYLCPEGGVSYEALCVKRASGPGWISNSKVPEGAV